MRTKKRTIDSLIKECVREVLNEISFDTYNNAITTAYNRGQKIRSQQMADTISQHYGKGAEEYARLMATQDGCKFQLKNDNGEWKDVKDTLRSNYETNIEQPEASQIHDDFRTNNPKFAKGAQRLYNWMRNSNIPSGEFRK